jgi:hypothetical protein
MQLRHCYLENEQKVINMVTERFDQKQGMLSELLGML